MTCLLLFYEFFKTGLFAVGGGLATLPFLYDMAARHPEWITVSKLADLLANPAKVAKYKAEAPDYICHLHNWDTVTQRTLAVYRGAVPQEEPHRDLLPAALAAELAKREALVRGK